MKIRYLWAFQTTTKKAINLGFTPPNNEKDCVKLNVWLAKSIKEAQKGTRINGIHFM